jgi:arabinofuranosyltransferase
VKTISIRLFLTMGLVSGVALGGYLLTSATFYRSGFPLDDAWIHQTYARNLALYCEWAFVPGEMSGGSTSPLWGASLAIGQWFGSDPLVWTYLLGWLSLWGLSIAGIILFSELSPQASKFNIWLGVLLCLEWHLVWMAGSGMETIMFSLIVMVILGLLVHQKQDEVGWFTIGILIGVSVWLRPDGITLLAPALMVLLVICKQGGKWSWVLWLLLGFCLIFASYLVFTKMVAGSWWPNTFYAKQAEYASLHQIPFTIRLFQQFQLPLVGVGIVLLPGFVLFLVAIYKNRKLDVIAVILWMVGYLIMYAWSLPVTYQHGRYAMPMMPVYFVVGFSGFSQRNIIINPGIFSRVLLKTWSGVMVLVTILFGILGAKAYARDVAIIESEMVTIAHWINQNTAVNDLIAAHDIGAIGYFGDRKILDLAGLISPDVIPFIRDEYQLEKYLDSQGADYLVTFPDWYPSLVQKASLIFQTNFQFSPLLGGENMAVYKWPDP